MAELTLSEEERLEVDQICNELDPSTHHLTADLLAEAKDEAARKEIVTYMRSALRGELIAGLIARAAGDALVLEGVADSGAVKGMLCEDFDERYRAGSRFRSSDWQYNLGRVGDDQIRFLWALKDAYGSPDLGWAIRPRHLSEAPIESVREAHEHALMQSFYVLLDAAHDRMFGSFNDELESIASGKDE